MQPPRIVVEIGQNHQGDLDTALHMIRVIREYCCIGFHPDSDVPPPIVKFQKRSIFPERWYHEPHPNPHNAFGVTYAQHRQALEFFPDQHKLLKQECEYYDMEYACSVWDLKAAQEIAGLYPRHIKIPSACNLHFEMLAKLAGSYEGELHVSLGMTTYQETERIVSFLERLGVSKRTWLYACTSGYPVSAEETALGEIRRLREIFGHRVGGFGFSGHHLGISIDAGAVGLGVSFLERHFTLDRTWKGTDHAASLEPEGLRKLMRDVQAVSQAMGEKGGEGILEVELAQRAKLKHRETDRVIPSHVKESERLLAEDISFKGVA